MYWGTMLRLATFLLAILYKDFHKELDVSAVVFSIKKTAFIIPLYTLLNFQGTL